MKELIKKWRSGAVKKWSDYPECERDEASVNHGAAEAMEDCANELEAALKSKPIESAPKDEHILVKSKRIGWVESWFDETLRAWETFGGWLSVDDIEGWLPLPSVGGEE